MKTVYVIAGSYKDFKRYMNEFVFSDHFESDKSYQFVVDADQIRGLRVAEFIICRTAKDRKDWPEIYQQLQFTEERNA